MLSLAPTGSGCALEAGLTSLTLLALFPSSRQNRGVRVKSSLAYTRSYIHSKQPTAQSSHQVRGTCCCIIVGLGRIMRAWKAYRSSSVYAVIFPTICLNMDSPKEYLLHASLSVSYLVRTQPLIISVLQQGTSCGFATDFAMYCATGRSLAY